MTKKVEAVSATELAEKLRTESEKGNIDAEVIIVYLASLNFEVGTNIAKSWKQDDETKDFFLGAFMKAQPGKWYIKDLFQASRK